eukprot:m.482070 g.482070  ORF g.482070 m.482070 type:complete len:3234 (-) comp22424_c0_seq1:122-9823(-)
MASFRFVALSVAALALAVAGQRVPLTVTPDGGDVDIVLVGQDDSYLEEQNFVIKYKGSFPRIINGDFQVQVKTQPLGLDRNHTAAAMYCGSIENNNDVGFGFSVISPEAIDIYLAEGKGQPEVRQIPIDPPLVYNESVAFTIEVTQTNTGRRVDVFRDGNFVARRNYAITSTIFYSGPCVFGQVNDQTFVGYLQHVAIAAIYPCDSLPCGDRADCVNLNKNQPDQTFECVCKVGFSGIADNQGQGCTPVEPSCKTCDELNWSPGRGSNDICATSLCVNPKAPVSWETADQMCRDAGARLCTAGETKSFEFQGTGCGYDAESVWTQESCGADSVLIRPGSPGVEQSKPEACVPKTSKAAYARCCADQAPSWRSRYSCAQLGWSVVYNNACGESELPLHPTTFSYDSRRNTCFGDKTFFDAESLCAAAGARLCTLDEVKNSVVAGTGCQFDGLNVWTRTACNDPSVTDGVFTIPGRTLDTGATATCREKTRATSMAVRCCADAIPDPTPKSEKTCSALGIPVKNKNYQSNNDICGITPDEAAGTDCQGDSYKKSFDEAQQQCKDLGMRLCTFSEILSEETRGTGCGYDYAHVWTSTDCRTCNVTGKLTHAGSIQRRVEAPKQCSALADRHFVRCCADAVAECTTAGVGDGDCGRILRKTCSTEANQCGDCLPGLTGSPGPSNVPDCVDNQPPVITCPTNPFTTKAGGPNYNKAYTWKNPTVTDNVGVENIVYNPAQGSSFGIGDNEVSMTATDAAGNSAECTFIVRVEPDGNIVSTHVFDKTLDGNVESIADQDFFTTMFGGDFSIEIVSSAAKQGEQEQEQISQVPFYLNSPVDDATQMGLSMGAGSSADSLVVKLGDGSNVALFEFSHPAIAVNQAVSRRIAVRNLANNRRRVSLFINDELIGTENADNLGGPLYDGQGAAFGKINNWEFDGFLTSIKFSNLLACDDHLCGDDATCVDSPDGLSYTCRCKIGFTGTADLQGRGCTRVPYSCKTCAALGWSTATDAGGSEVCNAGLTKNNGACVNQATYADAKAGCEAKGARLCTLSELMAEEGIYNGCAFGNNRVWTADPCNANGHKTKLGRGTGATQCKGANAKHAVICCADNDPHWRSEKSCAELRWRIDQNNNNDDTTDVCGSGELALTKAGVPLDVPVCSLSGVPYHDAELQCAMNGARLCTTLELAAGEASTAGCIVSDFSRVWAFGDCDENGTKAWTRPVKTSSPAAQLCLEKDLPDAGVMCCADVQKAATIKSAKTCSDLKWNADRGTSEVCGHSLLGCTGQAPASELRTFADAEAYCAGKGARLCTYTELLRNEAAGTGCSYDNYRVWTQNQCRTQCGQHGHFTHAGALQSRSRNQKECTLDAVADAFVRCCADTKADCTKAGNGDGNCGRIRRQACSTTSNTCGPCLEGLTSPTVGDSNNNDCADTTPPTLDDCPADITMFAIQNSDGTNKVEYSLPVARDQFLKSVTASKNSGTWFPVGTRTVTVTAEDVDGNKATCSFDVTIKALPYVWRYTSGSGVDLVRNQFFPFNANVRVWKRVLNGNFQLTISTMPDRSVTTARTSEAPLYLHDDVNQNGGTGMSLGFSDSVTDYKIRLGDGTNFQARSFFGYTATPVDEPSVKTVTVVRRANDRLVTVKINGKSISKPLQVNGDIYNGGDSVFGKSAGWRFAGQLLALEIRELTACDTDPCDASERCIVDPDDFSKHTCECKPGFDLSADGTACVLAVRSCKTCDELNWEPIRNSDETVCAALPRPGSECPGPMSHGDAVEFCTSRGARLCTSSDLSNGVKPSGLDVCQYRLERTWTADTCAEDGVRGFLSQAGLPSALDSLPVECTPTETPEVYPRCCADTPAHFKSAVSCDDLGLATNNLLSGRDDTNHVCGKTVFGLNTRTLQKTNNEVCFTDVTWHRAEVICAAVGMRLCTPGELANGEAMSGSCGLNTEAVWSSAKCGNGNNAVVRPGGVDNGGIALGNRCRAKDTKAGVRCCADRTPLPVTRSVKSCQTLSAEGTEWAIVTSKPSSRRVCGHSLMDCAYVTNPDIIAPPESEKKTYQEAKGYCENLGARLCTFPELTSQETASTGCLYDREYVWSSSICHECTASGRYAHAGSVEYHVDKPQVCLDDDTDKAYVRCCADVSDVCSSAGNGDGNCAALLREPCTTTKDTCGNCFAGFSGTAGPSNEDDCVDTQAPSLTCPEDLIVRVPALVTESKATWAAPAVTDNGDIVSIISEPAENSTFPFGTTTVTYTATDSADNDATCTFTVSVKGPGRCPAGLTEPNPPDGPCVECGPGVYAPTGSEGNCEEHFCPLGTVDDDSLPSTECVPCDGEDEYADELGLTVCKDVTLCPAGETEVVPPSAIADRVCTPCDASSFKPAEGNGDCTPIKNCAPGEYIKTPHSLTSDRVCEPCPDGTYQSLANQDSCIDHSPSCPAGTEQANAPSAQLDRACKSCDAGTFKEGAGLETCRECTSTCPPGQFLIPCTTISAAQCVLCPGTMYKEGTNADTSCSPQITSCPPGEYLTDTGSSTRKATCEECEQCSNGFHQIGGCVGSEPYLCDRCKTASECRSDQYLDGTCEPTKLQGPTCGECHPSCLTCDGPGSDRCLTCHVGLALDGTTCTTGCNILGQVKNAEGVCQDCDASCVSCFGLGDNQCLSCPQGQFLLEGRCQSTCHSQSSPFFRDPSSGRCTKCKTCKSTEFVKQPCSENQDTVCETATQRCPSGQYESAPQTTTSNRKCTRCSDCQPGQYVKVPCGADDTQCDPCLVAENHFSSTKNALQCELIDECPAGTFEVAAPTAMSNRRCQECAAGTVDDDSMASTTCQDCPAGSYAPPGSFGSCTPCREGQYDHDSRPATPCIDCNGIDEYSDVAGATSCKPVTDCPVGSQPVEGQGATKFANRICRPCTPKIEFYDTSTKSCKTTDPCSTGIKFETAAPTAMRDRQCGDCTTGVITTLADGTRRCTRCPRGSFRVLAGTDNHPVCQDWYQCYSGAVEVVAPTSTSDRVCQASVQMVFDADYSTVRSTFAEELRASLAALFLDTRQSVMKISVAPGSVVATVTTTKDSDVGILEHSVNQGFVVVTHKGVRYAARAPGTAARSSGGSDSNKTTAIAIGAVLFIGLVAALIVIAVMVYKRRRDVDPLVAARPSTAFTNPIYSTDDIALPQSDTKHTERLYNNHEGGDGLYDDLAAGQQDEPGYLDVGDEAEDPYLDVGNDDDGEDPYMDVHTRHENEGDDDDQDGYMDM